MLNILNILNMLNILPIGLLNSVMRVTMNDIGLKPVYVRGEHNTHSHELYKIVPVFSYLRF
jgi:hypothetical protein